MTIKKHIPNCITSLNLVCGICGIVVAFKGQFDLAFALIMLGSAFDFLDGLAARALNAYSDLGKELDSLCDLVTFGVLPAIMLYSLMKVCTFGETWVCWIPLAIAISSALRLAIFNVDKSQHHFFKGIPTPMGAMITSSFCCIVAHYPASLMATWSAGNFFIPAFALVVCFLLNCKVPMLSFKINKTDSQDLMIKRAAIILLIIAITIVTIVLHLHWSVAVFTFSVIYILKNLVYYIFGI